MRIGGCVALYRPATVIPRGKGGTHVQSLVLGIARQDLPFLPPAHWAWARLIDIARPSYGFAFPSGQFNSAKRGMPLIRIRDISHLDAEAYFEGAFDKTYVVTAGDYLVGMDGDFNLRLWRGKDGLLNQRVMRVNDWRCGVDPEYIKLPLQFVLDHLHGETSLTTVKHLSAKQVNGIEIPLPPLAEQKRIVDKVDELMPLCDRLDKARTERETTRDRLMTASLARLNEPDPENFHDDARFALEALPSVTAQPDQIKHLRQTILNLAMRGKLGPQDPKDKPASNGGRKSVGNNDQEAMEFIGPFALPSEWCWSEFGEAAKFENGDRGKNYPNRDEYVEKGVAWINTGHIQPDGSLSVARMNYITRAKYAALGGGKIRPGDLVYCLRGATFGKTAFVEPFDEGAIASSLMIVRPGPRLDRRFTFFYLISPLGRSQLMRFDNGTAQPNLSSGNVKKYFVPIPPLAEQKRIVAKVDELMAICDQLEASLTTSEDVRSRLLDVLLHEALEPALEDATAPSKAAA
jgi:type I restriction enzyme, S subunit